MYVGYAICIVLTYMYDTCHHKYVTMTVIVVFNSNDIIHDLKHMIVFVNWYNYGGYDAG